MALPWSDCFVVAIDADTTLAERARMLSAVRRNRGRRRVRFVFRAWSAASGSGDAISSISSFSFYKQIRTITASRLRRQRCGRTA
jgi:hypothetical protein